MALAFRDDESLRVVLASGLCPADVQARGARLARAPGGALILAPERPLPAAALASLRAAGIATDAELPADARAIGCWAEALALARVASPEVPALVLFTTARAAGVVELAAELLRLGCERQELRAGPDGGAIRVVDPPTYTVMRALERDGDVRVFAPDPAGQEAVWTELGYRHPLAGRLRAPAGQLLLVSPEGWEVVRDAGWRGLDSALELAVAGAPRALAAEALPARRRVELRLAPGRREAPSLWVLRGGGIAAIDRLLAYLPDEVVARLVFAAAQGGDTIVLRARAARHAPPDLSIDAETYAPLAGLPDVYAPAGAIVEPPLRRERLRAVLGVETGDVAWLAPLAAGHPGAPRGPFRVERIADRAFTPLAEWADYVIHANAPALAPWLRAATFDFAPFVSTGLEWADAGAPLVLDEPAGPAPRAAKGRARDRAAADPEPAAPITPPAPPPPPRPRARRGAAARVDDVAPDAELAALEEAFVALDAPADAPARLDLFEQLGRAYARLGRRRDAGLCFARAAWERAGAGADARLDAWLDAELGDTPREAALARTLALTAPATEDVRLVAALAARAPAAVARDPHRVQRWLDDHDRELDARSCWLARVGLARLAGGDPLGLAHARDRILARLAAGLSVERELPAFLRVAGRRGGPGHASGDQLAAALEQLVAHVATTKRKRSPVETNPALTAAYVALVLAHGFARIAHHDRARALVGDARAALAPVAGDPVHDYLLAAYAARIEQAIAGQPPGTPLPDELVARHAAFERMARYKVDRLREASRILEPHERPDAIAAFSRRQHDARGPEFAALRTVADPAARARAVGELVDAAAARADDRVRLLDGSFDVLLELPEALAVPVLARAIPIVGTAPEPSRAVLYGEALVVAGHFGRTELVPGLLAALGAAVPAVPGEQLARVLDQSLRALRRIGLRHEIAALLAGVERALGDRGGDLIARLAIAGGLAYLGDTARALAILEEGRGKLGDALKMPDRLALTRALAQAYAQAPLGPALAGIAELAAQLRDIHDNFGTNSHFCLSVLDFVESLVLGVTSDDLALGEAGRRFVEDDEHLIRRRLHRDLGAPA